MTELRPSKLTLKSPNIIHFLPPTNAFSQIGTSKLYIKNTLKQFLFSFREEVWSYFISHSPNNSEVQ